MSVLTGWDPSINRRRLSTARRARSPGVCNWVTCHGLRSLDKGAARIAASLNNLLPRNAYTFLKVSVGVVMCTVSPHPPPISKIEVLFIVTVFRRVPSTRSGQFAGHISSRGGNNTQRFRRRVIRRIRINLVGGYLLTNQALPSARMLARLARLLPATVAFRVPQFASARVSPGHVALPAQARSFCPHRSLIRRLSRL